MLYVPFLFHFGPASDGTAAMSHISSALSTLQWLGLDRLANDFSRLSKDDPALRDLHPVAAFELVKVLVHSFCLLDGSISKRYGLCRLGESLGGGALLDTSASQGRHLTETTCFVKQPPRPSFRYTGTMPSSSPAG